MKGILDTVLRKSELAVFRKIGEECIVVPVASSVADVNSIFSLNETGAAIWEKIDGRKNLKEIVAEIHEEFETEKQQLEKDAISFIQEMIEAKLIEA
jgi:hypothetical protein